MTDEQPNTPPAVPENTPEKLRPRDLILMLVVVPVACFIAGAMLGALNTETPDLRRALGWALWACPIAFAVGLSIRRGKPWGLAVALAIAAIISVGVILVALMYLAAAFAGGA